MKEIMASIGTPEASELVLCKDSRIACETYIFEPTSAEETLGRLYAVGETEDRQGIGKELLDMTIQALQREYYRDPARSVTASFESALHQANIVLHDAAEQGVRDWMGYWNVAVAVVADEALHISTAGKSVIFLIRKGKATLLTQDLSYSPITDPLRTFAQVASGALVARDVLFMGTAGFPSVFRREDLVRFSIEHSAQTIGTRLEQLHADQQSTVPLAGLIISILPRHIATARPRLVTDTVAPALRQPRHSVSLLPRQPIVIHRTAMRTVLALTARLLITLFRWLKNHGWPLIVRGSVVASRNVQSVTWHSVNRWKSHVRQPGYAALLRPRQRGRELWLIITHAPNYLWQQVQRWIYSLPRTSKMFAGLALILTITLLISLLFLQSKRADDAMIQQASESLHAAQTKLSAVETALIYDNRDQARNLLNEATSGAQELLNQKIYIQEAQQLLDAIAILQDRLQKVVRASTADTRVVGDFGDLLETQLGGLVYVGGRLFSFNRQTNEILVMTDNGETSVASTASQGIGLFQLAVPHHADKNIVLVTNTPGIALFDTKTATLNTQDISWPDEQSEIGAAAVFGSRLYAVKKNPETIYSFNKTLRGYTGRTTWLIDQGFPIATVVSLAVDGSIYTLHSDGSLHKLFKGELADFTAESVDPPLKGARKILTYDGWQNLYVFDPDNKRVAVFTKNGSLVRQIVLDVASQLIDIAVSDDESSLYVLDGSRVLAILLSGE